jgi:thiamine-phosphate pyrophosphorylase
LHQQQLALDFGINRIHFTENAEQVWIWNQQIVRDGFVKSTSTHTMILIN